MAGVIAPLTELMSFYAPRLPMGSGTSLGAALNLTMDEIQRNVVRSSGDQKAILNRWFIFCLTVWQPMI